MQTLLQRELAVYVELVQAHVLSSLQKHTGTKLIALDTIATELWQPHETCRSRLKQVLREAGRSRQAELVIRVPA